MIARRESLVLSWLSANISKSIFKTAAVLYEWAMVTQTLSRAVFWYQIKWSHFKGNPAGSGLWTWQQQHTPQGRVENKTFSLGGLHYGNTGLPFNVCVCNALQTLAHVPIRFPHRGAPLFATDILLFYLCFVCWCKVRSGPQESGGHLQYEGSGAKASELERSQNQTGSGRGVHSWSLGHEVLFVGKKSLVTHLTFFDPRLCFGKPVTQRFLGVLYIRLSQHAPQFEVSSRTEIGIVEKIMCKFCFPVSSRKN